MTITDVTSTPLAPWCSPFAPRILAAWHQIGRADLGTHLFVHGPLPLPRRGHRSFVARLVEEVRDSGLTGRGGAGFPAARKWDSVRSSGHPLLVVNAMEGEPASSKDRALLSGAPHLVLDGAQLDGRGGGGPRDRPLRGRRQTRSGSQCPAGSG